MKLFKIALITLLVLFFGSGSDAQNLNITGSCIVNSGNFVLGADQANATYNSKSVYYNAAMAVNYQSSATSVAAYLYYALASELGTAQNRWVVSLSGQPYYYAISDASNPPTGEYLPFNSAAAASDCGTSVFISYPNAAPSNISLSASSIDENVAINSVVGTLGTTDPDAGNTFSYSLVSGAGSADNATFNIVGSNLRIGISPDFETRSSYSIRIRSTDQGGLFFEKAFTITINNIDETPLVWYLDADRDGHYVSTLLSYPNPGAAYTLTPGVLGDCNDADVTVWQSANFYVDADLDGYHKTNQNGVAEMLSNYCYGAVVPNTGPDGKHISLSTSGPDCNDNNAQINPGAAEICGNGIDDNCDGISSSAPTITCPGNITVNNDPGKCGAVVSFGSATTTGSPAPVLTYSHASGSLFPIGTTTVTVTATNSCGAQSCNFTVTVNDHEAPVINVTPYVPSQVTLNMADRMITYTGVSINGGGNSKTVLPGSTVNLAYAMSVSFNNLTGYCPSCYAQSYVGIGGTNQAIQCEDKIGNGYSRNRNVNFTAPTAPGIYYITQGGSLAYGCVSVSFNKVPSNAIGVIVVGSCHEILLNSTSNQAGTNVTFSSTAADCSPVVLSSSKGSGSFFPIGSTQVTVTAVDSYNNTSTCTFMVTVADARPAIICPANITANNSPGQCGGNVTFAATAQALGAIPGTQTTISYSPASGSYFPTGTTTVTATATNEGNTATCTFMVNMVDNEKPVLRLNNYVFSTSENSPLEDLSSGAVTLFGPNTDDVSSQISLPFDFIFNNINRTQTIISSNGLMTFENSRSESFFGQGNFVNSIMPLWGDLYTGTNGWIRYKVLGNFPSRKFVVEWNVQMCCSNAPADKKFQVWLFEGTNNIQIVYGAGTNITPFNYSPGGTIGLSGQGVTDFNLVTTSSHTSSSVTTNYANITWPGAGRSYTFTKPGDRYTATANAGCGATVNVDGVQFADDCGIDHTDAVRSDGLALSNPYPVGVTTVSWTATDINSNVSNPVVQTVTVTGVPSAASPATQSICSGDAIANIVLSGGLEGTTFGWTRNGIAGGIPFSGSGDISGFLNTSGSSADVTFTITPNYNGCAGTPFTAVVTVNPKPQPVISGALAFCAGGSTTLDAGAGYNSYLWSTGAVSQTIAVSNTTPVSVTVATAAGCSATSESVTPTVNTFSTEAISINTTASSVLSGQEFTLSVNDGSLGTDATWNWYTSSCGGTLIGTGASISVSQNVNTTYFARAEGICNTTDCASITVNSFCGATGITSSAGTTAICAGSPVTLTVIGSLSPGAEWSWDDECENDDNDDDSFSNTATFTVSPNSTKTYYVRSVGGTCGLTACVPFTVTVIPRPAAPTSIIGNTIVCTSSTQTYSIAAIPNATSYTWALPPGISLAAGSLLTGPSTSITVLVSSSFNSGPIRVRSSNCSGFSNEKTMSISKRAVPSTPGTISGASPVCTGSTQTYSISAVTNASNYTWTLPTGMSFAAGTTTNGTSVQVVFSNTFASGTISVKANNNCGASSSVKTKTISGTALPTQASTIIGVTSLCNGSKSNVFSVTAESGFTFNWTVPTGATITTGQGTNSIKVTWGSSSGSVSVTKSNGCGVSLPSTKAVSSVACREAVEEVVETIDETISLYPNPASQMATLNFSSVKEGAYQIRVINALGQSVYSSEGKATQGANTLELNLENFSTGLYIVQLVKEGSRQQVNLIKK